jgi:hypothetical protein
MDTLDVYKTDGDWRLSRRCAGTKMRHTFLEHNCGYEDPRAVVQPSKRYWHALIYTVEARNQACALCQTRASDGLQAIFWIMKEEPI